MRDAGLLVNPDYFQEGDWSIESGQQAMTRLLQLPQPPTAVLACNDQMAIGAILAAQAMNVRVPEEVAIAGFDDIPAASWSRPRLTTVTQPAAAIGRQLAEAVFARIEGISMEQHQVYEIASTWIVREST